MNVVHSLKKVGLQVIQFMKELSVLTVNKDVGWLREFGSPFTKDDCTTGFLIHAYCFCLSFIWVIDYSSR